MASTTRKWERTLDQGALSTKTHKGTKHDRSMVSC
jgi:hypothetical protein